MNASDLTAGLAGAARRAPGAALPEAIVLGAVGSLGEALMARLLASPAYARIHVGVERAMPSTSARFAALPLASGAPWPAVRDAFLCETPPEAPVKPDAPIRPLAPTQMLTAARAARAAGVSRLVLVAPLAAVLQLSGAVRTISQADEIELVALGFETLLIVRPAEQESDAPAGGWFRALVRSAGRAVLHIMLPPTVQPLRAETAAAAILAAVARARPGIQILGAKELAAIVAESQPAAARPRRRW